ncbi:MAG: phospholipase D-like domain-containing protein [Bacteroidota bacterium]|nr:phospholipase D-like domain-containing protein [Bacteroidota bacterium]
MRIQITIMIIALAFSSNAQDIATARSQGIGATVTVTGIVTNGDELGPIRYIEDGTAGLAIYDLSGNNYLANVVRGDSITVSGILVDYNGLMEMNPTSTATIHAVGNILPGGQIVTPSQIGEATESELIQINDAIFVNGGSNFAVSTYDFSSNGQQGKTYIRTGHPLVGKLIPVGPVTLIGISSQYTFSVPANDGYQVLPRDSADIIFAGNLIITSPITQSNITNNSFELSWTTSDSATTNCNYGLTSSLGTVINNSGNTTNHTMTLTGLQPATFYYVECYSINGLDTATSSIGIYTTASNSSGKIRPYFNHSVDTTVSIGVHAQDISVYFNDTIKAYIDRAQNTLDICVYNASDATIATAINDAHNRGVQVRYIADDDVVNAMLGNLNSNISVIYRDPSVPGIMHNKFMIIDANSTNNSWIMGGSCNWTNPSNLFNDYNNIIFIQDEALAKAYQLEFNEMWNGDFGNNKLDNTPHKFNINGIETELYFSPSDQTTSQINRVIESVDYTLEFGLLSFTRDDIGATIISVNNNFGTNVRGIIEQENITGSEYADLLAAGVNVKSHQGISNQLHHKYAIIDAGINSIAAADPIVLTGSHNWSTNAEVNSDENTLIIHDHTIANIYLQEFTQRFNELSSTAIIEKSIDISIYPNPTSETIKITSSYIIDELILYDTQGRELRREQSSNSFNIYSSGIYFLKIVTENKQIVKKIVVE